LGKKQNYSITFYTGGADLDRWDQLPQATQNAALKKSWYIKYWYRNPKTGLLERQANIKAGINRYKNKAQRVEFMRIYAEAMVKTFAQGFTPFAPEGPGTDPDLERKEHQVREAIQLALDSKKATVGADTHKEYQRRGLELAAFLEKTQGRSIKINQVTRRHVAAFLDEILKKTSARNRNNARASLSAIFAELRDRFLIDRNFIDSDIRKLKIPKKTDRRIPLLQVAEISRILQVQDPLLLLYLKVISYNFLRPIEANRLRAQDVNLDERTLFFTQKTKIGKTKYIPKIYFKELGELVALASDPQDLLFTPSGIPGPWELNDRLKRDYFTKRWAKFKKKNDLQGDFTLYSFRHTFISAAYTTLKNQGLGEGAVLSQLAAITGHYSPEGLKNYIHTLDADLPADWSDLFGDLL